MASVAQATAREAVHTIANLTAAYGYATEMEGS